MLDHPSLEPFEPIITEHYNFAFGNVLNELTSAGFQPGDEWHTEAARMFRAACLPGFKRAQDVVGAEIIELEKLIKTLKKDEALARSKRDASVMDIKSLRRVLENRQLVLRRLLDGMVWVLIWPRRWVVPRIRLEGDIRRVDPATVEPLLNVVSRWNLDSSDICILCDLTTVAQLGDLIVGHWIPERNAMNILFAELKVGPKNKLLYERLHDLELPDYDDAIAKISEELGPKAEQQARRIVKQEKRLKDFTHVIATGEGVHPVTGHKFRLTRDSHSSKDYRDQIWNMVAKAKREGQMELTLDSCLRLIAIDTNKWKLSGLEIAHWFHLMRGGRIAEPESTREQIEEIEKSIINAPKVINLFEFNMKSPIALPPLLWYPRDAMLDVLMGRIKIFAQFDHEKFFKIAAYHQLNMNFITGKEAAKIKQTNPTRPLIEYRDYRYVKMTNSEGIEMLSGAKLFSSIYTELIRPYDLLVSCDNLLNEAARDKKHS